MGCSRFRQRMAQGALGFLLCIPFVSLGQQSAVGPSPAPASASGSLMFSGAPATTAGSFIQMFGYVVAILMIVGAAVVFFMRSGGFIGLRMGTKAARKLHLQETWMLGHKQFLAVIEYEGRKMLLGVCPGRIDYLCPLEGNEDGVGTENAPDFQEMLARNSTQSVRGSEMNTKPSQPDAKIADTTLGKGIE
jgi:flagellar protein FliO/FliZ